MTALASLLVFGTLWFWLFIIAAVIGITALIECDNNAWADIVFIGTIIALYKLGCGGQLAAIGLWISQNWFYSILIFLGYLFVGALYSIIKWALFLSDAKDVLMRKGETRWFNKKDWTPGNHKARIIHWMTYWPISGIWTLISNPVRKMANRIFYKLEKVYQNISDRIMVDIQEKLSKNK